MSTEELMRKPTNRKRGKERNPGKDQTGQRTKSADSPTRTKPWPVENNKNKKKRKTCRVNCGGSLSH